MHFEFDLLVIGSGPAGQKAAIQAAKLGVRVALVERGHMIGGVCTTTGTIPSKTLREAVIHLTGLRHRGVYGRSYRVKSDITMDSDGILGLRRLPGSLLVVGAGVTAWRRVRRLCRRPATRTATQSRGSAASVL
jgi:pyruvate/2-oxoglutarate dehydrogenase complex dihydrolipoamide dehydrogenase (E3) component